MTYGTNSEPLDGAVYLTFTCPGLARIPELDCRRRNDRRRASSLTVYVFNSQRATPRCAAFVHLEELSSTSRQPSPPHSAAGTTCDFYAVEPFAHRVLRPNRPYLEGRSLRTDYNGTFAEVSTKQRADGFVMSDLCRRPSPRVRRPTLRWRSAVRGKTFSVQTTIDAAFAEKYSGTITVTGVKALESGRPVACHRARNSFARRVGRLYPYADRHRRSGQIRQPVLRLRKRRALAEGSRVQLEITASFTTPTAAYLDDLRPCESSATVPVTGKAGGAIVRNGYYRIEAAITGLVGSEVERLITVSPTGSLR